MRSLGFALACSMLCARVASAELEPKSRNTMLFVESAQKGHEWEPYRLAEDRRPVILEVRGPGRALLSLRTFAGPDPAVSVVLLDDRIILTAKVEPKVDESAKFPDEQKKLPSKVHFYLVRVPSGTHRVTIRYSGGGPTLVAARFSETDAWEEGQSELVMPKPREGESVPTIGSLHTTEDLEAEPQKKQRRKRREVEAEWTAPIPRPTDEALEPRTGPPREAVKEGSAGIVTGDPQVERTMMVQAPWLMFEIRGGAQFDRLAFSVAPIVGVDARIPLPGLDARSFSAGLAADVAYSQGESTVAGSQGAVVGVAEVRHVSFTASADLRWVFLRDQPVEPYLAIGGGGIFGSMSSKVDEQRITAATRGGFGLVEAGAALGGLGHRPYVVARLQAGLLASDLIRANESAYLAGSLMIGFRFEFLTEVSAAP